MRAATRFGAGITRYEARDAAELAEFQRRQFGPDSRQVDRSRFEWLFERNPCRSPEGPGLWLCRRGGVVVGQQAEIPFDLLVGDVVHRAAWAIDLMVGPVWRVRGVGPALVETLLAARPIVGAVDVTEQGGRLLRRSGWADLGVVADYVRPLRVGPALRAAPVPAGLRWLARVGAPPALAAVDAAAAVGTRLVGARLVPVDGLDDRVDEVWGVARHEYPVLAVRDAATSRWRLDQRPDASRLQRYYLERDGRTLGYVVLRPTVQAGKQVALVVDYLAPRRWVVALLAGAAARARADGAVAMRCRTLNPRVGRGLRAAGFVRRDPRIRFLVHCRDDAHTCALVTDPRNWLITSADCDLEYGIAGEGDETP